jgi:predicted ArsR family transcriptional regulator
MAKSKITPDQKKEIYALLKSGQFTQQDLADHYGVSRNRIRQFRDHLIKINDLPIVRERDKVTLTIEQWLDYHYLHD